MQTKRDYLVSLGLALPGTRGRFSREGNAALAKALSDGMSFTDSVGPKGTEKVAPVVRPDKASYNPSDVRTWAKAEGRELPARGKIPFAVINDYLTANPDGPEREDKPTGGFVDAAPPTYGETHWVARINGKVVLNLTPGEVCDGCNYSLSHCYCESGPVHRLYGRHGTDLEPIRLERV